MHQCQIILMPTGKCNLDCRYCAQKEWRLEHLEYQMTPDEVERFCVSVRQQGLHYAEVHLLGGEPALWEHLDEGCRLLREYGVADRIDIYSNCADVAPLKRVLDKGIADRVVTQTSNMSRKGVDALAKYHPDKILVTRQSVHKIPPDEAIPHSLPSLCGCDRLVVFRDTVWSCPGVYHNSIRLGLAPRQLPVHQPIDSPWFTYFSAISRYTQPACTICLANGRVWDVSRDGNNPEEYALQGSE
ncbi:MAG: radical SAM protein [Dehalococcoidales bacterium]|nr:radical SAM protein [Dehalococcoidales bacterium]